MSKDRRGGEYAESFMSISSRLHHRPRESSSSETLDLRCVGSCHTSGHSQIYGRAGLSLGSTWRRSGGQSGIDGVNMGLICGRSTWGESRVVKGHPWITPYTEELSVIYAKWGQQLILGRAPEALRKDSTHIQTKSLLCAGHRTDAPKTLMNCWRNTPKESLSRRPILPEFDQWW